jgi:hypothetical protein
MITLAIKAFLPKSSRLARLVSDVWGAYDRPPASFSEMLTHYRTARDGAGHVERARSMGAT